MLSHRRATPTKDVRRSESAAYFEAARRPVHCLVFLFPLLAAYEVAALLLRPETWPDQRLVAQRLIQWLAAWLGTDAIWVPGAALLLTLVAWQFISRESWRVRGWVPALMVPESLVLALPLLVLGQLLQQTTGADASDTHRSMLPFQLAVTLGAGIYEELVFRFYFITGLTWLFLKVCHAPRRAAVGSAVGAAAVVFAACHLHPVGVAPFEWPRLLTLTVAGGYLGLVFVTRGLGVTTGCHVAHNLIVLAVTGR